MPDNNIESKPKSYICSECGVDVSENDKICNKCGADLTDFDEKELTKEEKAIREYVFQKVLTPEQLSQLLQNKIGSNYRITAKKKMVVIVKDSKRGCQIPMKYKKGKTICYKPIGFMPSIGLQLAWLLGTIALFLIVCLLIGDIVLPGAILALIIFSVLNYIMKVPSVELVKNIDGVLRRIWNNQ